VSPIRALLAVHLSSAWRRSQLDFGPKGQVAAWSAAVLLGILVAVPALAMFLAGGYFIGTRLSQPGVVHAVGALLAVMTIIGGAIGRSRVLDWESTRIYPLRLRSLFVAELIAGAGDLLPLVFASLAGSMLLGIGLANPRVLPLLLVPWLVTCGGLLLLRQVRGGLTAQLSRHLKTTLFGLAALCIAAALIASHEGTAGALPTERILGLLPTTQSMQGVRDAVEGRWALALIRQAYPLLVLLVLFAAAALLLQRESMSSHSRSLASGTEARLWSFSTSARGVARLQWVSMMRSSMVMGLLVFVALPVVLHVTKGVVGSPVGWLVPMTLFWVAFLNAPALVNQFGLDGRSVAGLLVLPIRSTDLLQGKALGFAAFYIPQVVLVVGLMMRTSGLQPAAATAALCLAACQFLLTAAIGHFTSVEIPRPLPRNVFKSTAKTNPSAALVFASLLVTLLGSVVFGGAYVYMSRESARLLLPTMTGLLAGTVILYRTVFLPLGVRRLDRQREVLMHSLG
jgi:hypothetical protein